MNRIGKTIRHHILRLFHLKKAKTLHHLVILKYIQGLNFNKRKTEDQILASLSSLEIDKFLKYNDNYDSYSLLISVKELENEISNQPRNYASNPELIKLCGSLDSELDIGKLKDLLLKQIKKSPHSINALIGLIKQKGFTNPEKDIIAAITKLELDKKIVYDESINLFSTPEEKKKKQKKQIKIVQIKCPNCPGKQNYRYKNNGKRHHTTCKQCSKNIEVNSKTIWDPSKELKEEKKVSKEILFIDSLDKKIIEIIKNNKISHAQKNIAKLCQKHPSTISRHIKKLINTGIIISISKITGIYKIASDVKNLEDEKGKITGSTIHNLMAKTWIMSGTLTANFYQEDQMTNWIKKHFNEQDLDFQVNFGRIPSIVFHPTGIGKTENDAILNAKKKSREICEFLEQKYELELSPPEFKEHKIHYVNITTDPEIYNALEIVWTDKSHPGALETGSKDFSKQLRELLQLRDSIKLITEQLTQQKEINLIQNERINNQNLNTQDLKNTILNEIDNKLIKFEKSMATAIGAAIGEVLQKHLPIY